MSCRRRSRGRARSGDAGRGDAVDGTRVGAGGVRRLDDRGSRWWRELARRQADRYAAVRCADAIRAEQAERRRGRMRAAVGRRGRGGRRWAMRAIVGLCVLLVGLGVAWAEKPVVVIVGDDAAVVSAVEKAMRGKVEQVGEGEMARATAVVEVSVTGKKKAKQLTAVVKVTQVADGAELGR